MASQPGRDGLDRVGQLDIDRPGQIGGQPCRCRVSAPRPGGIVVVLRIRAAL
jgi:hypothetical protein